MKSASDDIVKVHIVLKEDVCKHMASRIEALHAIEKLAGISEVNQKRFQRYGLISGSLSPEKIETVKGIPSVASVSIDSEKFAISH